MPCRRAPALPLSLLLLLVVAAPAAAFPDSDAEVDVRYAAAATPIVLAAGAVELEGLAREGLFVGGLNGTRLGPIFQLDVGTSDGESVEQETHRDVFLVLHRGTLVWMLEDQPLPLEARAAYGLGVGLPKSPFGDEAGRASAPGILMTGPGLSGALRWEGHEAMLLLADATVSIQDRTGQALPGWDHRRVNEGASPGAQSSGGDEPTTLFIAHRPFDGTLAADAFATSVGTAATMRLAVLPSSQDRLPETLELFTRIGGELNPDGGGLAGGQGPLEALEGFSGLLNGAILLLGQGEPGAQPAEPTAATIGGEEVEVGTFALMRSRDLAVEWGGGEMRVQGTSSVAATQSGFAVKAPAKIGFVPLLSAFLWALAAAALVVFFVKRPPKGIHSWTLRAGSAAFNAVVFLLAFYLWDVSFAETFGTSFLTRLMEGGVSADAIGGLGTVLGLQMLPWSVAALFFALPVRIALGVGLRYLGRGKSYKGVANAGGLVALAVFGPLYALWLLDVLIGGLVTGIPAFAGGG